MPTTLDQSIGIISPPPGVDKQIASAGTAGGDIAIFWFISNLMKVGLAFIGVWVIFNFILAGYTYITGKGGAKATETVRTKITMSIIGLALIVGAYTMTAVLSYLLFGDSGFILHPEIEGP